MQVMEKKYSVLSWMGECVMRREEKGREDDVTVMKDRDMERWMKGRRCGTRLLAGSLMLFSPLIVFMID